jgi:uncharacterized protein (TIGR04255 family)
MPDGGKDVGRTAWAVAFALKVANSGKSSERYAFNNNLKQGFRMTALPISIDPCPIIEAIFEIRFSSAYPGDAIFGIIYNQFKDEFQNTEPLPILQLPAAIRMQDPNLKFAPHYKLVSKDFLIQIGPNVFSLINVKNYSGWNVFSKKIRETYEKIISLNIIEKHDRTALRYINLFQELNIFDHSMLQCRLGDQIFGKDRINFTAEVPYEYGVSNLKVVNFAEIFIENKVLNGSIVDIDTQVATEKCSSIVDAIECAHHAEKNLFFNLLKKDFLDSLSPEYKEG